MSVVFFLFPLLKAKSLAELAFINNLFDEYKTFSSVLRQLSFLLVFSIYNATALQLPMPGEIQVLRAPVYGIMGYRFSILAALATCQMLAVRIWLFVLTKRHHSQVGKIGFMRLLEQLNAHSKKRILFWLKFISLNMIAFCYVFTVFHIGIELYVSTNYSHFYFSLVLSVTLFFTMRYALNDVLILYVYALAGSMAILDQMKNLRITLAQCDHFSRPLFAILQQYFLLTKSIKQLNPLSKFIVSASKLLTVPFGGMIFIFSSSPAEDLFSLLFKIVILGAAIYYALHGYLLIVGLAQVSTMSKVLYGEIHSIIAGKHHLSWFDIRLLLLIIEDASCSRSHLVIREHSGSVSQMDAFESITSTASVMTLFFTLHGVNP